jgi:hypothetical protein
MRRKIAARAPLPPGNATAARRPASGPRIVLVGGPPRAEDRGGGAARQVGQSQEVNSPVGGPPPCRWSSLVGGPPSGRGSRRCAGRSRRGRRSHQVWRCCWWEARPRAEDGGDAPEDRGDAPEDRGEGAAQGMPPLTARPALGPMAVPVVVGRGQKGIGHSPTGRIYGRTPVPVTPRTGPCQEGGDHIRVERSETRQSLSRGGVPAVSSGFGAGAPLPDLRIWAAGREQ